MGMSVFVYGVRKVDESEKFKRMLAVWNACRAAGIAAPNEVDEFFGDAADAETERDLLVNFSRELIGGEINWDKITLTRIVEGDCEAGYEVSVADLVKNNFQAVQFVMSY